MSFLVKTDFKYSIDLSALDALTGADDTIWQELSDEAANEMISYLISRYDAKVIFQATGTARDKTIVMYCKDLALFHLYSRRTLGTIPQIRIDRYNNALQWLRDVSERKINPDGFPTGTSAFVKYGSNEKRVNQQQ